MIQGRRSYRRDSPQTTPLGSPTRLRKQNKRQQHCDSDHTPAVNSGESSDEEQQQSGLDETPTTPTRTPRRSVTNKENLSFSANKSIPHTPSSYRRKDNRPSEETTPFKWTFIIFIGIVTLLFLCALFAGSEEIPTTAKRIEKCSLEDLAELHREQEKCIWPRLSAGIESILSRPPSNPGVFLFVHQGGKRIKRLIKDVATRTAKCFGQPVGPSEMTLEDFAIGTDYRNAIYKFKELVEHNHVVIVPLLNTIPGETAVALHTICDTYSPLAMDTIIFLSLKVPKNNEHPFENAENELREIWGNVLKQYQLEPLITRITEQVVVLN